MEGANGGPNTYALDHAGAHKAPDWIVFHDPVDRVIQLLNNQGLGSNRTELTPSHVHCRNENDKIVQRTKPA